MTINLKEYMGIASQVLRSSERVVQQSVDLYRSTPEQDGVYYDPEWRVQLEQDEAEGLLRNLRDSADLFQILAENADAAADLLAAHRAAQESPQGPPKEGAEVLPLRFDSDEG